ncbi:type II toxin-antitoxin system VapC family toxin [Arthrobacter castelli]|uniref:type II toxin-antitoxin system VapC family toxin n=1 Tax=Arthrobacter castelli TaxID=271431 RepID=UPI00040E1DEB|nr:type II toxin-antitoxin system VapC family toxin [Arthrobacter castelli]
MIVIDASAAVDLLLSTDRAGAVGQALSTVGEIHAPELIEPEIMSVVRRWTLRGWLPAEHGRRAVEELGELSLVCHRHAGLRRRVWELRNRCSAYGAFYVALAEVLDAELLTTDDRLRRAAGGLIPVR